MSDPRHRVYRVSGPEQFGPTYGLYDNSFPPTYSQAQGPPPHFDAVGYWYRPEPQEGMFDPNEMLYNPNMQVMSSPIEQHGNTKHRRTRSGCFTCRSRRVKCDETRPICERCKKGNRECQFPQPSSGSRRMDTNDARSTHNRESPQDLKNGSSQALSTIDDDSDGGREGSISPSSGPTQLVPSKSRGQAVKPLDTKPKHRRPSTSIKTKDEGSPRSTRTTSPPSRNVTPGSTSNPSTNNSRQSARASQWKNLPSAIQQYLRFHQERITRYHYFLRLDHDDFIHNELIDMALSFEPLLYAIVGFTAYHYTLSRSNGEFQDFWKYYCQSIELLRKWLEKNTDRNEQVLLTILQLATFEEYLGDWASLASHQKAAHSIFSTLYTYEDVMSTKASRCIFDWLARADLTVSLMGGSSTVLERQWFTTALEWHQSRVEPKGLEASTALPCFVAKLRLLGYDMAAVFTNAASNPNTLQEIRTISKRMENLRLEIEMLHNATYSTRVGSHDGGNKSSTEEATDSRILLFRNSLWPLNFLWVDWYATEQMHKFQTLRYTKAIQAKIQQKRQAEQISLPSSLQNLCPELEKLSLMSCQLFEAIEKSPHAPSGAILVCQASLGLASLFLKKTPKFTMWARRKLAHMERMGYIWPPSFRKQMSQLWNDDEVLDWWLPNGELKIGLLDEIRGVVEERNQEIEVRGGDERDDVREIKAVFEKLDFGKGGLQGRRDSVWSAAGVEVEKTSSPDDSDSSDEEDDSDENEHEHESQLDRRRVRGGSTAANTTSTAPRRAQPPPPTLEYSNRMSGIWQG